MSSPTTAGGFYARPTAYAISSVMSSPLYTRLSVCLSVGLGWSHGWISQLGSLNFYCRLTERL